MYITYKELCEYYGNDFMDEETFNSIINIACSKIDEITRYRVKVCGIDKLHPTVKELFKLACIVQCAYVMYNGVESSFTGQIDNGYTVGKVSVQGSVNTSATKGRNHDSVSPEAISKLEQTGLLDRSVGVYYDQYLERYYHM